ncbi:MAG: carboxylesterase family protein [Bdellovibrionales bacterium]
MDYGVIRGYSNGGTYTFKGVPYAQPPIDHLRWKKPLPLDPGNRFVSAKSYRDQCTQPAFNPILNIYSPVVLDLLGARGSEDCLNLNIWVPARYKGEKLPVAFFIHGGGHFLGSNQDRLIDGKKFAKKNNVIFVSINYRLGPLGFMAFKDLIPPNLGLYDILLALKWVNENIESFGGDDSRITIMGESAGGANVLALMASPLARGLFSAAIVQSGHDIYLPLEMAHKVSEVVIENLNCDKYRDDFECLNQREASDIVEAISTNKLGHEVILGPVVDGEFLLQSITETFRLGRQNKVPVIVGTNADEMTTVMTTFYRDKIDNEDLYEKLLKDQFGDENLQAINEAYPPNQYSDLKEGMQDILGDFLFHGVARSLLAALANTQDEPVYRYVFSFKSNRPLLKHLVQGMPWSLFKFLKPTVRHASIWFY